MLKAYFDESGIHKGAEVCVVAGYWGKKGAWRRFDTGWKTILRNFRVPLQEFHAKDAVNGCGFFHGWSDSQTTELLHGLGRVTASSSIHPVCWAVYAADFFALSLPERRFLTGATWHSEKRKFLTSGNPNRPYFVSFTECIKIVTGYTPPASEAHFFFGCDRPVGEYARKLYRYWQWRAHASRLAGAPYLSRFSPDKFGLISFPWAKETPALQVADLFAYLTYCFMIEHRHGNLLAVPDEPMLSLLRNRRNEGDTCFRSAELMREVISVVPNLNGNA